MAVTTEPAAPVMRNETPCPSWCAASHTAQRAHGVVLAERSYTYGTRRQQKPGIVALTLRSDNTLDLRVSYDHADYWVDGVRPVDHSADRLARLLAALGAPKWMTDALRKVDETAALMLGVTVHTCHYMAGDHDASFPCDCPTGQDHELGGTTLVLGEAVDSRG